MQRADPAIKRPIFVLGTGRSGTTLFLRLLSAHPDLAWFSNIAARVPRIPALALYSRIWDLPWIEARLSRDWTLAPKADEAYPILNHATDSVFTRQALLSAADVTASADRRFRALVRSCLRWQGKRRFVNKHTGFPRIDYLSSIFPDALFIHVFRDGRAVANSLLNVSFWDGTLDSWWWGRMKTEYEREYRESGEDRLVLAAITWKTLIEHITEAQQHVPEEQFLEVRYDRLVADPAAELDRVLQFCDLPRSPVFQRRLSGVEIRAADHKWRTSLSDEQIRTLDRSLGPHLKQHGFPR